MSERIFSARQLVKHYRGQRVVDDLSFEIRRGECLGFLGPNGAGKTTTIRMCLGLIGHDAGDIMVFDHPIPQQARIARQRIGVVTQFDSLDPDFTCAENLMVFGRYFGIAERVLRERTARLLEFAGLQSKASARPGELSGGMRRQLSLARALINEPELLVLDEPTTGLDPQARRLIWERLGSLLARGVSILLTTHFMDEAQKLCHRLVIIDQGRKIAEGSARELIEAHLDPWVTETSAGGDAAVQFQRPSNLEDLFLHLTGRSIEDEGR